MTDQHPLTDEICRQIADTKDRPFTSIEMNNMRAAADWQLEQVIRWINETIFERGCCLEAVDIPEELVEAMRPTTQ